ncbi:hypothetical protein D3C72_1154120 [compost metagenome]
MQCITRYAVQEIGLILVSINRHLKDAVFYLCVVTSSDHIRSIIKGGLKKQLKLHFLVAHNIWIRSTAGRIFVNHIVNHFIAVLTLKVKDLKIDAQLNSYALCISQIVGPRTLHTG